MNKFLETCNFPRLSSEELENLTRPITSKKIETVIQNLPKSKSPEPAGFTGEFYQKFKDFTPFILKPNYSKKLKRREYFLMHFMRPTLPWDQNQSRAIHKKENDSPISMINIDAKILTKTLVNQIQQYIKKIIHQKVGSFQECKGDSLCAINQCDTPYQENKR